MIARSQFLNYFGNLHRNEKMPLFEIKDFSERLFKPTVVCVHLFLSTDIFETDLTQTHPPPPNK